MIIINKFIEWIQEDAQILNILWNSLEPQVLDMSTHLDRCKEDWDYVRLLYSSNLTQVYDLSLEYFLLQQAEKSITEYFASPKKVYVELNLVLPISADVREMQK